MLQIFLDALNIISKISKNTSSFICENHTKFECLTLDFKVGHHTIPCRGEKMLPRLHVPQMHFWMHFCLTNVHINATQELVTAKHK